MWGKYAPGGALMPQAFKKFYLVKIFNFPHPNPKKENNENKHLERI